MSKLENLFSKIRKRYPELKNYKFSVKYKPISDAFAQYSVNFESGEIAIDVDTTLRDKSESIKTGAITSELSHILKDRKVSMLGPLPIFLERYLFFFSEEYRNRYKDHDGHMLTSRGFNAFVERKLYDLSEKYRAMDERHADIITVSKGFGDDLLELLEYEERRGEDEDGETHEGLTSDELKKLLRKK